MEPKIFDTKMCKYGIFVAKMCKYGIFVAKICKYGIFVAKICKYALIDSFQGYAAVLDSSTNCAALATGQVNVLECMRFHLCGLWSQLHCLLWTLPLVSGFHFLYIYEIAGWWFAIYRSPVAEGKKTFIRQPRQFF